MTRATRRAFRRNMATVLVGDAVVSPDEIIAAKSPAGGWTRATLASWGAPWPLPKGWRAALEKRWLVEQERREMRI